MNRDWKTSPKRRSGKPAGGPPEPEQPWATTPGGPGAPSGGPGGMPDDPGVQGGPPSGRAAAPPSAPPSAPPGGKGAPAASRPAPRSAVKFTRLAAAWWAVIVGSLFLIVLLVFIAQNMESIAIRFLGWTWHAPLGVSFLAASVCGALITVMIGASRMIQLRRAANRNLRKR